MTDLGRPDTGWTVERFGDGSARQARRRLLGLDLCVEPAIAGHWDLTIDPAGIRYALRGDIIEQTFEAAEMCARRSARAKP